MKISGSVFQYNVAPSGGAIYIQNTDMTKLTLLETDFISNSAISVSFIYPYIFIS